MFKYSKIFFSILVLSTKAVELSFPAYSMLLFHGMCRNHKWTQHLITFTLMSQCIRFPNVVCATSKASDQPAHTLYAQSDQSLC